MRNLKDKISDSQHYAHLPLITELIVEPSVANGLAKNYNAGTISEVNLIGHSLGAGSATRIACRLKKKSVPVAYMGLVDGASMASVCSNVSIVDNFRIHLGNMRLGRNFKGRAETFPFPYDRFAAHIQLGNSPKVHATILERMSP